MPQFSTGRAQVATDRTTEPPLPSSAPTSSRSAQEGVTALHGVMTGLANLVNEQLGRMTIGPQATRFLRHLERQTFGNAGLHRRAGRHDPGLWCPYVHAEWAAALELSASALTHLRTRLVGSGILWYTPDSERRGVGAVGWSFDFAAWKSPQWGGARTGAGRPCAAPSAEPHMKSMSCATPAPTIQDVNESSKADPTDEIKMSTNQIQNINASKSRRQRALFMMSMGQHGDATPAQEPAITADDGTPQQEWKQERKRKRRRTDAVASGVTSTPRSAPATPDPPRLSPSHAAALERSIPPRRIPSRSARGERSAPAADEHPPPVLPYETLRSYWLRIFREGSAIAGAEARPIVHAAARALVGMGSERSDYVLLGQLHQAAGNWATVLHWLLECGARELADPRSYLRAIATRQSAAGLSPPSPHAGKRRPSRQTRQNVADPADISGGLSAFTSPGQGDDEPTMLAETPGLPATEDSIDLSVCVSATSLWQMARQRLRADVSAAQYTSWLVGTDLVRAPDDTYVLLTRTTFAAEHIHRQWGERIAWILSGITGRRCTLTTHRQRLDTVPDG